MRLAVVGAGWAGLAAAVRATQAGHQVTLYDMAAQLGGRARSLPVGELALDNGQHILIGAYHRTLDLMRSVGVDPEIVLRRLPLELRFADGRGLRVPPGPAWLGLPKAVWQAQGWSLRDKLNLVRVAASWAAAGFQCPAGWTAERLCQALRPAVRELLIDPLCVAALNTSARDASASVLLRVLKDALFGPPGSADLLLPRRPLDELLPAPAARWLRHAGARIEAGHRVAALKRQGMGWVVDGQAQDAVILACTATEAARLAQVHAPAWAAVAGALRYEPIITVYLRCAGARLRAPMTALLQGPRAPAQHAFDHGALGAAPGLFAFVVSGAQHWVEQGLDETAARVLDQARACLQTDGPAAEPELLRVLAEKRATFRCTPGLARPSATVAEGLVAAGDYVAGPYPATLEGAVRAGEGALRLLA